MTSTTAGPVGVGIIGLGMALKPHALALRDLEQAGHIRRQGAFSPSETRRESAAAEYGLRPVGTLDALITDPAIDLIAVLTPPWTHLDLVRRIAGAGKHIMLEKPIEATLARAETVVETCESAGVHLAITLQHRFRPGAAQLRALLRDGRLGDILSASASIRWWRPPAYFADGQRGRKARDGGGVLLTQAIHQLDLLLDLAGPVRDVTGFAATSPLRAIDTEDIAAAAIRFDNGAIGVIDATTVARPGWPERLEIAGTRGSAVLEVEHLRAVLEDGTVIDSGGGDGAGGGGADPMAFAHDWHRDLYADALDAIRTGRPPRTNGRSALQVHRLIDGILRGAAEGKSVRIG